MKRIFSLLLAACLLTLPCRAIDAVPEESFDLKCTSALLMERQTGTVIYAKNAHERLSPASVTKVMTLLLVAEAVDSGAVALTDTVTASPTAASMGGSQIWLEEGEKMSLGDMLKCVAVVSANDCAVALAEHLCGSESAFVQRMNRRAGELGCTDTHFTDCTGLFGDPDHYTSAYDVALLSRALLAHDCVRQYTSIWMDSIRGGEFGLTNTNKLVHGYDGCTGLKTGFTTSAMFCLAASAMRDGTEYIAVILHGDTSADRFNAARALLDYAFANYALVSLRPEAAVPPVPVELGASGSVQPVWEGEGVFLMEKAMAAAVSYELCTEERVTAPVEAGQRLGTLTVRAGDQVVAEAALVAPEAVARLGLGRILLRLAGGVFGGRGLVG